MIVYDLNCQPHGHRFEGWFGSREDFEDQRERGLLACPECGSGEIVKRLSAPAVPRKSNSIEPARSATNLPAKQSGGRPAAMMPEKMPAEVKEALTKLAKMQQKALEKSEWVGDKFADEARAMHYGEKDADAIHGTTTPEEAEELAEEGVPIAPLPFPVVPPEAKN